MKLKLLLLLSLLFPGKVFSQLQVDTIIQDNVLYTLYSSENGSLHAEASKYKGYYRNSLSLPSEIQKDNKVYPLTTIGDSAFFSCDVRSIIIPEPVCSIGQYAFAAKYGFTLENIKLPSSLISIGSHAFSNIGIIKIDIPESVTRIGEYAFWGCGLLNFINLPSSLTSIGDYAFDECLNIRTINYNTTSPISANKNIFSYKYANANIYRQAILYISSGGLDNAKSTTPWKDFSLIREKSASTIIDNIEYSLFSNNCHVSGCKICDPTDLELPETILIDNKEYIVDAIAPYAFAECEYLSSIVIPESVTNIGNGAFLNCKNLKAVAIFNPYSPITINKYAFYHCHQLKQFYSVGGLGYIGDYAFSETSINDISTANDATLYDNSLALAYINVLNLGSNISFRSNCLNACSIGTINYNTYELAVEDKSLFNDDIYEGTILNVPFGMLGEAMNTEPWMYFKNINEKEFPNPDEIIRENGLEYTYTSSGFAVSGIYSPIHDVIIPRNAYGNSVVGIADHAFKNCFWIKSMVLPSSIISIGDLAFSNCTMLSQCEIPQSVSYIGKQAFSHCSSLSHIEIPNSIQTISDLLFEWCSNLTSVKLPITISSIGGGAFQACTSLTDIELPSSIKTTGDAVFNGCSSLQNIVLPNSITHIGYMAFSGCQDLKSVKFPDKLKSIDWNAFASCVNLESVNLPSTVESIAFGVFQQCKNLTSVELPCSIKDLGSSIFSNCSSLKSIVINGDKTLELQNFFGTNDSYSGYIVVSPNLIEEYKTKYPHYNFISGFNFTFSYETNNFEIGLNDRQTLTLSLDNAEAANGFQTDITLPAGLSIAETADKLDVYFGDNAATDSHVISAAKVDGENKYRIVAYSSKNEAFKSGDNLLNITIVSGNSQNGGDITLDNTLISLDGEASYSPESLTIKVAEFVGVKQINLTPTATIINLGKTVKLTAEVLPSNAWVKTLTWSSSNESVATVSEEGVVTPVAKGVAIITATSTDGTGVSASATVTVTNYMQSLSIVDNIAIEMNETLQLNPVFTPANADATEFIWSSSNAAVAYVDAENVLHALTAGTVTITATNVASGLEASITVTVGSVLYGDSNDNGIVAIDDVVTDVQYILEKNPTPFNFKKADVNRDNAINIIDVSKTVSIILTNSPANVVRRAPGVGLGSTLPGIAADDVTLTTSHKTMTITLGDVHDITALQGDIELPEGVSITSISLAASQQGDHSVAFAQVNHRCVRFAIYSLSLARMNGNTPMIQVELDCDRTFLDGNAKVFDIIASDIGSKMVHFDSLNVNISNGNTTGMDEHLSHNGTTGDVYTLQGICVMRDATQSDLDTLVPGIYIVRRGNQVEKVVKL